MEACQAAIVSRSGAIVAKAHEPMKRGHAEYLIPMIGGVLEAAGLELKDLTRIGVTVGPGTFAGLRVGLSAARSFGLSHDIPIVGVTTLEAVAVTLPEPEAGQPLRAGVIAFDARNDEVTFFCPLALLGWDKNPAIKVNAAGGDKVSFAFHSVLANKSLKLGAQ